MGELVLRSSSVRKFHETPMQWYKDHILGENTFEGNTATYLGTVIHLFAETYFTEGEFNVEAILEDAPANVDKDIVLAEYQAMCDVLEEKYLSKIEMPSEMEMYSKLEIDGITFQGTCDAIMGKNVLVDYKTSVKAKSKMDEYIQQLNIYAYLASLKGYTIDTLRVVNVVRKTKTMPPRVIVLECDADVEMGKALMELMVKKTRLAMDNPEVRELIFGENPYSFLSDGFSVETNVVKLE